MTMSMTVHQHHAQVRTASGLDVLAAAWLIVSPWVLGYQAVSSATSNDVLFGAIICILALVRTLGAVRAAALSWTNAILGLWFVISPWVLGYSHVGMATTNSVVVGVVVMILACWSALATPDQNGDAYRDPTIDPRS